jgi:hypothetical protein
MSDNMPSRIYGTIYLTWVTEAAKH